MSFKKCKLLPTLATKHFGKTVAMGYSYCEIGLLKHSPEITSECTQSIYSLCILMTTFAWANIICRKLYLTMHDHSPNELYCTIILLGL